MAKYIPISIVLFSFALAMYLSDKRNEKRQMKRLQLVMVIFLVTWCWMNLKIYPQYIFIE